MYITEMYPLGSLNVFSKYHNICTSIDSWSTLCMTENFGVGFLWVQPCFGDTFFLRKWDNQLTQYSQTTQPCSTTTTTHNISTVLILISWFWVHRRRLQTKCGNLRLTGLRHGCGLQALRWEQQSGPLLAPPAWRQGWVSGQLLELQLGLCWAAYWSEEPPPAEENGVRHQQQVSLHHKTWDAFWDIMDIKFLITSRASG